MRLGLVALSIAIALLALGNFGPAAADQIVIGGNSSGSVVFTSNGDGTTLNMNFGTLSGGTATFEYPNGTTIDGAVSYSFTQGPNPIVLTLLSNGTFSTTGSPTVAFSFGPAGSGDSLTGTVSWTLVQGNTGLPQLLGSITITSVTGTSTFLSDFHVGDVDSIDLTLALQGSVAPGSLPLTLNALAGQSNGVTSTFLVSAGQTGPAAVPEPASLLLFGSGLIGLGALGRRRRLRLTL